MDGEKAVRFYGKKFGTFILPGNHMLELAYKVFSGNSYKTQNIKNMNVYLEPKKRYIIQFGDESTPYSLVELESLKN